MRKPSLPPRAAEGVVVLSEMALVALCRYEEEAITGRRLPTVSSLCRKRRWVEAALLAVLLAHLHVKLSETVRELESCEWEAEF